MTTTEPRARFRFRGLGLGVYAFLALAFLLIPIVYTFVFSFNDAIKNNIAWRGFTLHNWTNVCDAAGICDAAASPEASSLALPSPPKPLRCTSATPGIGG